MPVVSINDVSYTVPSGTRLGELLARETKYEMPCGGQGRCGKCKVTVRGAMNPLTEREKLHLADIDCGEVSGLLIAGGFGSYLNVENAGRIGLIPGELVPRVRVIGNAALSGAAMLLLNQEYRAVCERYAGDAKGIELSNDPFFSEEYMAQMMF